MKKVKGRRIPFELSQFIGRQVDFSEVFQVVQELQFGYFVIVHLEELQIGQAWTVKAL